MRPNFRRDSNGDDKKGYEPVPAGDYPVIIVLQEEKRTKAGTGAYLEVGFEIASGPAAGRRVFARFNTENPNPQAVEIGLEMLEKLYKAAGLTDEDSTHLIDKRLAVKVSVEARKDTGSLTNSIKSYRQTVKQTPQAHSPLDELPF